MGDRTVSIGILAHNEELNIDKTLRSLFGQDLFEKFTTEIVIVANGCADQTVRLAERSLADHRAVWSSRGSARVEDLKAAGKANAWNQFVHTLSSPAASVLILMDADITLLSADVLSSMVTCLECNPQAAVCVDRPIKDITISTKRTFFQSLLLAATPEIDPDNAHICGQLYCALSEQLRLIELPVQIQVEDGFLGALVRTYGFTRPEDLKRIILSSTAAHSFAPAMTISEIFNHEKWIVAGSIVNTILFERFWNECAADRSAMSLMRQWKQQDPEWLSKYLQDQVRARGWQLLPKSWWTRRWSRLLLLPFRRRLRRLPVAAIAAVADAIVFLAAIGDVRRGRAFRYWGRK